MRAKGRTVVLALCWCAMLLGSVALVGSPQEGNGTAGSTTVTVTGYNVGSGNALAALVNWGSTSVTISSVTDTGSTNAFAAVASSGANRPDGFAQSEVLCAKNTTAVSSDSITVNFSASTGYRALHLYQVSGADASNPCAAITPGYASSGGTLSAGPFTTTVPSSMAILLGNASGSVTWSLVSGSGYTLGPDSDTYTASEYQTFTSIQTGAMPQLKQSGTGPWVLVGVVIKGATTPTGVTAPAVVF